MPEHTLDLTVYDIDKDEEGCARLHVNTNVPFGPAEAKAIARLIEAAPDLLAALEAIDNNFASTGNNAVIILVRQLEQARRAIAKATEDTN